MRLPPLIQMPLLLQSASQHYFIIFHVLYHYASPIHDSPKKPCVAPSTTKKPLVSPTKSTPPKAKVAANMKTASPTKVKATLTRNNNKSASPNKAKTMASAKKTKAYVNLLLCNLPYEIIKCIFILGLLLRVITTVKIRILQLVTTIQGIFINYFQAAIL